jgi:cysteine desulfurase
MSRAYLDANATSPLRAEARAALLALLDAPDGNASSVHRDGQRARAAVERGRAQIASLVAADPYDLVLTGSGTESNNLALYGAALAAPPERRRLVSTAFEHPSVLEPLRDLARRGFELVMVAPDARGRVDAAAVIAAADPRRTALVSVMLANHEVGTLQPIAAIADGLKGSGIVFHSDAAQACGRVPLDVGALGVDLLSLAAHKIGGPPGIGALWVRPGLRIVPHLRGGGQERGRRPGTEHPGLVAAFGAAAEAAHRTIAADGARLAALRDRLEREALARDPRIAVHGSGAERLPNTTNLGIPGLAGEEAVIAFDLEGVAISAGPACSSGTTRGSASLLAMGRDDAAVSAIRISLSHATTDTDVEAFLRALDVILRRCSERGAAVAGAAGVVA